MSLLVVFLFPLWFIFLNHFISSLSRRSKNLPPGPRPWPILGNIPHFVTKNPHISAAKFADRYGPLISFKLGTQLLVVGSSPKAAMEILKTRDHLLSARHLRKALPFKKEVMDKIALAWGSECNDHWKSKRTLCRTELFSSKAIQSQAAMRELKVSEMVNLIKTKEGQVVKIGELVFNTVFNMISTLLFSKDLREKSDKVGLKNIIWRLLELGSAPNVSDLYPVLAPLDLQGIQREVAKLTKKFYGVWEDDVKERREKRIGREVGDSTMDDFLDVFLANGFSDDQINWFIVELFIGGSDSTTTTVEWAMAELVKNRGAMEKAMEELKREFNTQPLNESRASQLPYLNACVKETLRLHPPAPFLLPHRAVQDCSIMGYTIPKNSQILVNVWAIGRDPSGWDDPLRFNPERFLGSKLDFKGQDFGLIPFGSGRRICPGIPMANRQVHLMLAALLHHFDWSLPNGEEPGKLEMHEKFGIALKLEKPLSLIPKTKSIV